MSLLGVLRPNFFTSNEYQYTGRKKLFAQKFLSVFYFLFYFILFATLITKNIGKEEEEKKKRSGEET